MEGLTALHSPHDPYLHHSDSTCSLVSGAGEANSTASVAFSLNNPTPGGAVLNLENSKSFLTMGGRAVIGPKGVGKFILFIR